MSNWVSGSFSVDNALDFRDGILSLEKELKLEIASGIIDKSKLYKDTGKIVDDWLFKYGVENYNHSLYDAKVKSIEFSGEAGWDTYEDLYNIVLPKLIKHFGRELCGEIIIEGEDRYDNTKLKVSDGKIIGYYETQRWKKDKNFCKTVLRKPRRKNG